LALKRAGYLKLSTLDECQAKFLPQQASLCQHRLSSLRGSSVLASWQVKLLQ
jgi:hypothetical protein